MTTPTPLCATERCWRIATAQGLCIKCQAAADRQARAELRAAQAAAPPPPSLFDTPLARTTDPMTSHRAAHQVARQLNDDHRAALQWLAAHGPATDDQVADAMVAAGVALRHEQARRWVRTLREHQLMVADLDTDGTQLELVNTSGRRALAWRAAATDLDDALLQRRVS